MPQEVEKLTYESVIDAANPGYPWTPPMANAAVPVGSGVLAYQPRLYPAAGADVAYPVVIDPSQPYPTGGGTPITAVALNKTGLQAGNLPVRVTTGPSAVALAAYFAPAGVPLDKTTQIRKQVVVPPSATNAVVTLGDPSIVNYALQVPTYGRQWTKASLTDSFNRANGNLDAAPASGGWAWVHDGAIANAGAVDTNLLRANTADSVGSAYKTLPTGSADHWVSFKVSSLAFTTPGQIIVCCRLADRNNWIGVRVGSNGINVLSKVAGTFGPNIYGPAGPVAVGDIIRLEVQGTTYTLKRNGTVISTGPIGDAALTSGDTGVLIRSSAVTTIDDFEAGTLVGGQYIHANGNLNNKCMVSADGINWHSRTPADGAANDAVWRALAYSPSLGRLVGCASSGANRIMTSDDGGDTWTARSISASSYYAIARSEELGLFVVGISTASANTFSSTNGVTWSQAGVTKPTTINIKGLVWAKELGLFVAVGDAGVGQRVLTSPDGKTWTARNVPADNNWQSVCWSASLHLLVAVANSGTNRIMTSPDGIDWTLRPSVEGDGMALLSVCRGGGKFVACGSAGTAPCIIYSADGITWFPATATNYANQAVAYSPDLGLFICLNNSSSTGRVQTSPDGINWTQRVNGPVGPAWTVAIWAAAPVNRFVALALTAGVNPELLTWGGLALKAGEAVRHGINVVSGAGGYCYVNPGRTASSALYNTPGYIVGPGAINVDADAFGFHANTDAAFVFDDPVAYRNTPTAIPQAIYDVYCFPVDAAGVEGVQVTKLANVNMV